MTKLTARRAVASWSPSPRSIGFVHFIGVGEGVDDLEPFSADDFARALVGL